MYYLLITGVIIDQHFVQRGRVGRLLVGVAENPEVLGIGIDEDTMGRNIYSHKKCIRLDLDLEGYSEIPSKDICNFNESLVQLLPELNKHRCGIDEDKLVNLIF